MILQTVIYRLVNCHLANYHLTNYLLVNYVFSFQGLGWAVKYSFIACGVEMDLRSFSLVKTHFDRLSFEEVSLSIHFYLLLSLACP